MRATLLATLALLPLLALLPAPATAADYTVLIGWETLVDQYGPAWYSLFFYPQDLTIEYGDSVTWVWNSGEVHNVVFSGAQQLSEDNPNGSLNPIAGVVGNQTHFVDPTALYSSGIRNNNVEPATLTFIPDNGGGTFPYYCSIHASIGMIASITVLPAGEAAPLTPLQINATLDDLVASLEKYATQEITALQDAAPKTGPGVTHNKLPDGTNEWIVVGGAMFMNGNASMYARFQPSYLEINVNDTVTWIFEGTDAHYVYFQIDHVWPLLYTNWTHNQTTPVCYTCSSISPEYNFSPGLNTSATYPNPSGTVNSGLLFSDLFLGVVPYPNNFSVKFVETGSFDYMCPLHVDIGMIAEVVVKPLGESLCTNADDDSTCAALTTTPVSVLGDPAFVGLRG